MNNQTEFRKKKEVILFIFEYSCVMCGLVDLSNHVHHINGSHQDNDVYNLAVLCDYCHKIVHKSHIVLRLVYSDSQIVLLERLKSLW